MTATFEELAANDGVEYEEIEAYGLTVRIASLTSAQIVEWTESKATDPEYDKQAGLWLLILSIVDDKNNRLPKDDHGLWLERFRNKADGDNTRVIDRILTFNDLLTKE